MKTFTLNISLDDDDNLKLTSDGDGFSPFELVGLLDCVKTGIVKQIGINPVGEKATVEKSCKTCDNYEGQRKTLPCSCDFNYTNWKRKDE